MEKETSTRRRLPFFSSAFLFRLTGTLLLLTLLSVWLICGLFAKYTVSETGSDSARIAAMGTVAVQEHEAVLLTDLKEMAGGNTNYALNTTAATVSKNTYTAVPGIVIPKDPFIVLDGKNEVACTLYLEVVDGSKGYAKFEIGDKWEKSDEFEAQHEGTIYVYKDTIAAKEGKKITGILKNNQIRIIDTYANKKDTTIKEDEFSIDFYAYLVQYD